MSEMLIDVCNLSITIDTFRGPLQVVRNQDIVLHSGEVLGIVGESGCGKSVMVSSLMGLLPKKQANIKAERFTIGGKDCLGFDESHWNELRGTTIAMVFQDPMTSLNPILTIGEQIYEVIHRSYAYGKEYDARKIALDILTKMGLSSPERRLTQYPHELSGGMRQRVCIAMAVAGRPNILICDEPTTALDITTEAQILRLLQDLAVELGIGIIFISHNLRIVAQLCDRVMVMYAGKCVEAATVEDIFNNPRHPYTMGLLMSLPQEKWHGELKAIEGQPPDLYELPRGCSFTPRCKWAMRICGKQIPMISTVGNHHEYTCWLAKLEGL